MSRQVLKDKFIKTGLKTEKEEREQPGGLKKLQAITAGYYLTKYLIKRIFYNHGI
ncbi:MAG: hypothetical protein FWH41_01235 [Treponema sp.]|nr:hypothetical protein [Treponema sp.]